MTATNQNDEISTDFLDRVLTALDKADVAVDAIETNDAKRLPVAWNFGGVPLRETRPLGPGQIRIVIRLPRDTAAH